MGIELELHSARPEIRFWDRSRATLLKGLYDHGDALAEVLGKLRYDGPGLLPTVDPYGNTMFDGQQARRALGEIAGLRQLCTDGSQQDAVTDLAVLLECCVAAPGSILWFVGD
ncbi:hypothetical protein [Kitasatospora sp. NPDC004531]